jgi:hypothetical protein
MAISIDHIQGDVLIEFQATIFGPGAPASVSPSVLDATVASIREALHVSGLATIESVVWDYPSCTFLVRLSKGPSARNVRLPRDDRPNAPDPRLERISHYIGLGLDSLLPSE